MGQASGRQEAVPGKFHGTIMALGAIKARMPEALPYNLTVTALPYRGPALI